MGLSKNILLIGELVLASGQILSIILRTYSFSFRIQDKNTLHSVQRLMKVRILNNVLDHRSWTIIIITYHLWINKSQKARANEEEDEKCNEVNAK